ncbi:MAG: TOBE domain-containing protein [Chthoniobacterales bacterium]
MPYSYCELAPNYELNLACVIQDLTRPHQTKHTQSDRRKSKSIVSDKVVSEVIVATAVGDIASIITTKSLKTMKLKKGDTVFALVKATEAEIAKSSSK